MTVRLVGGNDEPLTPGGPMKRQQRRTFTPQQRLEIVLEGLQDEASVSEVCRRHQVSPTLMELLPQIRLRVAEMDADLPLSNVRTLEGQLGASVAGPRFNMVLLGVFAVVALTLAAVGIYGVISYGVNQRTHEIGVRISLGANAGDLSRQIVGQGLRLALMGLGIGLAGSLVLTRVLASLLFGVGTADLPTFGAVALMVGFVAVAAAFIPARRASRIDPMVALRNQ